MNKVILNGIDISEAVDIVEKVKRFIKEVETAEKAHKQMAWSGIDDIEEAQWHFGYAESCRATINGLKQILG